MKTILWTTIQENERTLIEMSLLLLVAITGVYQPPQGNRFITLIALVAFIALVAIEIEYELEERGRKNRTFVAKKEDCIQIKGPNNTYLIMFKTIEGKEKENILKRKWKKK